MTWVCIGIGIGLYIAMRRFSYKKFSAIDHEELNRKVIPGGVDDPNSKRDPWHNMTIEQLMREEAREGIDYTRDKDGNPIEIPSTK